MSENHAMGKDVMKALRESRRLALCELATRMRKELPDRLMEVCSPANTTARRVAEEMAAIAADLLEEWGAE